MTRAWRATRCFTARAFRSIRLRDLSSRWARLTEFCGTGEACKPLAEITNVQNGTRYVSKSKDEANIDLRYTNLFQGVPYTFYLQVMNRDTGPITHSDSSHVFGTGFWLPFRHTSVHFTAEYGDTISTDNIFSFGKDFYGITYTDYKYPDGWQYRGRTLGSSLDTDSRLASFHATWSAPHNWTYTLSFYRAWINSPRTKFGYDGFVGAATPPVSGNRVTTAPVVIDIGEARVKIRSAVSHSRRPSACRTTSRDRITGSPLPANWQSAIGCSPPAEPLPAIASRRRPVRPAAIRARAAPARGQGLRTAANPPARRSRHSSLPGFRLRRE